MGEWCGLESLQLPRICKEDLCGQNSVVMNSNVMYWLSDLDALMDQLVPSQRKLGMQWEILVIQIADRMQC